MALMLVRALRMIRGVLNVPDVQQITFTNGTLTHEGSGNVTYTAPGGGSGGAPAAHAASHATGGTDPITPASIGAAVLNGFNVFNGSQLLNGTNVLELHTDSESDRVFLRLSDNAESADVSFDPVTHLGSLDGNWSLNRVPFGNAATRNVGASAGTVAAGDHTHPSVVLDGTLAGVINGSNATFTTASNFVPGNTRVFVNGLAQKFARDYTTVGVNTVVFTDAPLTGDTLFCQFKLG